MCAHLTACFRLFGLHVYMYFTLANLTFMCASSCIIVALRSIYGILVAIIWCLFICLSVCLFVDHFFLLFNFNFTMWTNVFCQFVLIIKWFTHIWNMQTQFSFQNNKKKLSQNNLWTTKWLTYRMKDQLKYNWKQKKKKYEMK